MSCNAWNHPLNCTCGWGGLFHDRGDHPNDDTYRWQRASSFTIPNAHCPVCNARVFFYKSPFGGSVYFDQIGPPWPKHPCTDHRSSNTGHLQLSPQKKPIKNIIANNEGENWRPFYCTSLHKHHSHEDVWVLVSENETGRTELFTVIKVLIFNHRAPFLIRRTWESQCFELSTLNTIESYPSEVRFFAYSLLSKLIDTRPSQLKQAEVIEKKHKFLLNTTPTTKSRPNKVRIPPSTVPVTYIHKKDVKEVNNQPVITENIEASSEPLSNEVTSITPRIALNPSKRKSKPSKPVIIKKQSSPPRVMTTMELAFRRWVEKDNE